MDRRQRRRYRPYAAGSNQRFIHFGLHGAAYHLRRFKFEFVCEAPSRLRQLSPEHILSLNVSGERRKPGAWSGKAVQNSSMCSRYQSVRLDEDLRRIFKAAFAGTVSELKKDVFPGYSAPFIRRPRERDSGDEAVPEREACVGLFGLLPHWVKDTKLTKSTYNARSETVATKPAFRDAWKTAKHCIIPAWAFYEPDWRSGKHIATRIARADGKPLGIAGLWSWWKPPADDAVLSFTMLTINADAHPVMCNYHRPDDEKRMIVLLREEDYDSWLDAPAEGSMDFMRPCPPEDLVVSAELPMPRKVPDTGRLDW